MDRSAVVTAFEFAKARLTGEAPKLGENRKVSLKPDELQTVKM
jgi:hypothetical protein